MFLLIWQWQVLPFLIGLSGVSDDVECGERPTRGAYTLKSFFYVGCQENI